MVQRLISEGLLRSPEVIAAIRKVPRELFVSNELHPYAYNDTPLPNERGQTISAPHGKESRAIYGGHNERSTGIEGRQQSARGRCGERLSRRYDRRAGRIQGRVYTIEQVPELVKAARSNLGKAG